MSYDIAIIGGGPVGLITALLLSTVNKIKTINIYEKRSVYSRDQIVMISNPNMKSLPKPLRHAITKKSCAMNNPNKINRIKFCKIPDLKDSVGITVKVLEEILAAYTRKKNNINIINKEINETNIFSLKEKIIIGADGYNSVVRKVSGIEDYKRQLGYSVIFFWEGTLPRKNEPNPLEETPIPQNLFRYFPSSSPENVNYGAVQISKKEFDRFSQIEELHNSQIKETPLIGDFFTYYDIKVPEKIRLVTIPLKIFSVKKVAKKVKDKYLLLIGDSTIGVNFFSGLGLNSGIEMANILKKIFNKSHNILNIVNEYNILEIHNNKREEKMDKSIYDILSVDKIDKECKKMNKTRLKETCEFFNLGEGKFSNRVLCLLLGNKVFSLA